MISTLHGAANTIKEAETGRLQTHLFFHWVCLPFADLYSAGEEEVHTLQSLMLHFSHSAHEMKSKFSLSTGKRDNTWYIQYEGEKCEPYCVGCFSGAGFCSSPSPPNSCNRIKFLSLSGAGPSQANYGPKSFYMNLCHAKTSLSPISSSPSPGTGPVLSRSSEQGNYVESLRPPQSKGRENKQKSRSPGPAETTSESVMQNKKTSKSHQLAWTAQPND